MSYHHHQKRSTQLEAASLTKKQIIEYAVPTAISNGWLDLPDPNQVPPIGYVTVQGAYGTNKHFSKQQIYPTITTNFIKQRTPAAIDSLSKLYNSISIPKDQLVILLIPFVDASGDESTLIIQSCVLSGAFTDIRFPFITIPALTVLYYLPTGFNCKSSSFLDYYQFLCTTVENKTIFNYLASTDYGPLNNAAIPFFEIYLYAMILPK